LYCCCKGNEEEASLAKKAEISYWLFNSIFDPQLFNKLGVVRLTGLEPATQGLGIPCSTKQLGR